MIDGPHIPKEPDFGVLQVLRKRLAHMDETQPCGDPDAVTCGMCGANRTLEGNDKTVGRRVLVCWLCDAPDPTPVAPAIALGTD